jgi:hypothetical protein
MNTLSPTIEFEPAMMPDEELANLRRTCVRCVLPAAPMFGTWLHNWIDREQAKRTRGEIRGEQMTKHDLALPPAVEWSDAELGRALKASAALWLTGEEISIVTGMFLDRITLLICEIAAERLEKRDG